MKTMLTKTKMMDFVVTMILLIILGGTAFGQDVVTPPADVITPARPAEPATSPSTQVQSLTLPDPLHGATIEDLLEKIVRWLRNIAAPIAAGMIIYGAYQMLFAAGDPEKFKVGRQTILYTVIGYAIIWIGWGITSIIKEFLSTP